MVVEDAPEFARTACTVLQLAGFHHETALTGAEALRAARTRDYDLILLDITLPDVDGFDVCRQLRAFTDTYIIMVTGRTHEVDRVVGLRLGADDYLAKPYSPAELDARIAAIRRRPRTSAAWTTPSHVDLRLAPTDGFDETGPDTGVALLNLSGDRDNTGAAPGSETGTSAATSTQGVAQVIEFGDLSIDLTGREATAAGNVIALTRIEFDLLATLAACPNRLFSREELTYEVWGRSHESERLVYVHMANLRAKLRSALGHAGHLQTVRGSGYRIQNPTPLRLVSTAPQTRA